MFGFAILVGCLFIVFEFESQSEATGIMRIFHWPAMVLTGIGPTALVFMCSEVRAFFQTIGFVFGRSAMKVKKKHDVELMLLQKISKDFYTQGPKVFETVQVKGLSAFIVKTIDRLSIRMPTPDVRELLQSECERVEHNMKNCVSVLGMGIKLTPSVGMLGTIMGMVNLLANMQDPSTIGSSMSLALLTTFFGLFFSMTVWTPLQAKVDRVMTAEIDAYEKTIRWLETLEKRKPATYFADAVNIKVIDAAPAGKK
ncbi:MAG: MotA/TolQ/ExbB proton channel family protein [Deltaproteobacteria bacterium]|nr:MotA/TolQ/ExbB proton channel family protein [Deltaproteobacteria bacterium]